VRDSGKPDRAAEKNFALTGEPMTTRNCLACNGSGANLRPLYVDLAANAQPIAWAHDACLKQYDPLPSELDDDAEDIFAAFKRVPRRRGTQ
jgi:hypothetical protein